MEDNYQDKRLADIGVTREQINSDNFETRYAARMKMHNAYPKLMLTIENVGGKKLTQPKIVQGLRVVYQYHSQLPAKVAMNPANKKADASRRFICFKDGPKTPPAPPLKIEVPKIGDVLKQHVSEVIPKQIKEGHYEDRDPNIKHELTPKAEAPKKPTKRANIAEIKAYLDYFEIKYTDEKRPALLEIALSHKS